MYKIKQTVILQAEIPFPLPGDLLNGPIALGEGGYMLISKKKERFVSRIGEEN